MGRLSKLCIFDTETHYLENKVLKWYRYLNLVLNAFDFMFFVFYFGGRMFLYLTYWGVSLTFIYYLLVSLSYQSKALRPLSYILFEIIWPMNIIITLVFWCYLFPLLNSNKYLGQSIVAHSFPIIITIGEYYLSKIEFYRTHYIYPILIMFLYGAALLLPYTLSESIIYIGITFTNGFTYIILGGCLVIIIISLEVGRFIRFRKCCPEDVGKIRSEYISQNQEISQNKYVGNQIEREEGISNIDGPNRDNKDNELTSFQCK
ncbi:hypothetical protein SteCoe_32179 [Stentor coeruleus]|uniref:Glycerophosphocholine acyltransferase 1 n=1 Tax=Stentor coeruleus TaxID=5963 RepID=A0A1R2AZM0_9CILI|nr:hypothetical protein SteCoe_32179 [Stentor coeruleus]